MVLLVNVNAIAGGRFIAWKSVQLSTWSHEAGRRTKGLGQLLSLGNKEVSIGQGRAEEQIMMKDLGAI